MKSASKAVAAVDPVRKLVYFGYVSASAIDVPDRLLAYSMPAGKWSRGDLPAARFTQMLTRGYTLDELDELSTNVDEGLPAPLDSDIYKGGIPVVGGFGPDLALYFSGRRGVEGTIETGDFPLADNLNRAVTSRVRLLAEGAPDATMQIAGKQSVTDAVAYGRICRVTRIGDFTERKSGRYHRFKFVIGGDWGNARGFEAEFRQEGRQ